jgi:serine/threonine protein phosphatase PrpC
VSAYLRENLPVTLNNSIRQKGKNILTHNIYNIIEDVFIDTNCKLGNSDRIDTLFSGSTCVSLIYTPEKLICANVGDSRAVIGKCVNGEWISHNLSRDHKPCDIDELARIKKRGGRVEPLREEDGEFVGPNRVWLKEDDIPGLAMSRSFGDRVAASVGVIAEPGIYY